MANSPIPKKERGTSIPVKVTLLREVYWQMKWMEKHLSKNHFGIHKDHNYIDLLKMQIDMGVKYAKPCKCNT